MEEHWRADPDDPSRRLHYATILGHCSRFHAARLQLDELVGAAAADRRLWALGSAGVACCDFQRFDWAAEFMQRAAAEPKPPAAVFHRWVESLERLNRLAEAAAALAEGQSHFPDHPGLMLLAARLARRSGALEASERLARAVIKMPEASPDIRCQAGYELGHALDAQDRCNEAYAAFVAAKEIQRPQPGSSRPSGRSARRTCGPRSDCRRPKNSSAGPRRRRRCRAVMPFWSAVLARERRCSSECWAVIRSWSRRPNPPCGTARSGCPCCEDIQIFRECAHCWHR